MRTLQPTKNNRSALGNQIDSAKQVNYNYIIKRKKPRRGMTLEEFRRAVRNDRDE
jgi:hypothetical protein